MTTKKKKKIKQYWYIFYSTECPVCGRGGCDRERVYTKPKLEDKYKFDTVYCGCLDYGWI